MKSIINSFIAAVVGMFIITGCEKVEDLPFYQDATASSLIASSATITAAPADSNKTALTLTWTYPNHATDPTKIKYVIEIDSSGRNFSRAVTKEITGDLSTTFTGNELNNILLGYGSNVGSPYKLDIRVISSYPNNNERTSSNIVNVTVTAFSEPGTLTTTATTVTGSVSTASQTATTLNWTKSFKSYSGEVTYTIEYDTASKNFSSPQTIAAGTSVFSKNITQKELNDAAINEGVTAGNTGKLEFRIKAMTVTGAIVYSNVVSITVNTYIPLVDYQFPQALWIAGNYQGWDPPSAPKIVDPSATGTTGTNYEGYINFNNASPEFKIVKGNNWGAGDFGSPSPGQLSNGGNNLSLSDGAGVYLLKANTSAMTWSATKINTWGIIGSATANGWGSSTPMTLNSNGTYTITATLTAGNEMKFRANDDWGINMGDNKIGGPDGVPDYNGDNIAIETSGSYLITLDLSVAGNYKYTVKKM